MLINSPFKVKTLIDDFGRACSELRKLPYGGGGNILVSRMSYEKEMAYRRGEISKGREFELPSWESLEIYES